MMKGKVEEAKQVLCYAAGVNKKTIPLSLLDKVRGLRPAVSQVGRCGRASFLLILLGATSAPLLEENGDGKIKSCQGRARGPAGAVGGRLALQVLWEWGASWDLHPASGWSCLSCSCSCLERRWIRPLSWTSITIGTSAR